MLVWFAASGNKNIKKWRWLGMKKVLKVMGSVFVCGLIIASCGEEEVKETTSTAVEQKSVKEEESAKEKEVVTEKETGEEKAKKEEEKSKKAEEEKAKEEAEKAEKKEEDKKNAETASQTQAVKMAESYISFTPFSKSGLIDQLVFEGFSNQDATYAAESINVDWKEQAVKMAESYLEYSPFSRSGLVEQLVFEGFSNDVANYAATEAGL